MWNEKLTSKKRNSAFVRKTVMDLARLLLKTPTKICGGNKKADRATQKPSSTPRGECQCLEELGTHQVYEDWQNCRVIHGKRQRLGLHRMVLNS